MLQKPNGCSGCQLEQRGQGFVSPSGPRDAELLFLGEASDYEAARLETPFAGGLGAKLNSLCKRAGIDKDQARFINLLSCCPPGGELKGAPYETAAIRQCKQYLEPVLRDQPKVVVALGSAAAKSLLPPEFKKAKPNDLHGTVNWIPRGDSGFWLVPTFNPQFLLKGNQKLTGVVGFDLLRAKQVLNGSFQRQNAILRVDPDLEGFTRWIDKFLAACETSEPWLAVDVETVEKLGGRGEDELEGTSNQIIRINFSYNPDEGVTVPWAGAYIDQSKRLLAARNAWRIFHNYSYDVPLLKQDGCEVARWHDTMSLFKVLQSDLPRGLGFIAPFYSTYGPWKHLNDISPGEYAAIDAFQTLRIAFGISKDLQKSGQWDIYMRHIVKLDEIVLRPAEESGLLLDPVALGEFKESLHTRAMVLEQGIQGAVGEDAKPWVGKRKTPAEGFLEREVYEDVLVCSECSKVDVTAKHICESIKLARKLQKENAKRLLKAAKASEPKAPKGKRKKTVDSAQLILTSDPGSKPGESN